MSSSFPVFSAFRRHGFTLVELLVVISLIGILSALLLVNLSNVRERGRDSVRKSDLAQMRTALRLYYNDFQAYPAASSGRIAGCGSGSSACAWGSDFEANGTKYMTLPSAPLADGGETYTYAQTDSGRSFQLSATLENLSDPQAHESQRRCGVEAGEEEDGVFVVCAE